MKLGLLLYSYRSNDNQCCVSITIGLFGKNKQNSAIGWQNCGNGLLVENTTRGGGRVVLLIEFSPKDEKTNVGRCNEAFEKFRQNIQNKLHKMLTNEISVFLVTLVRIHPLYVVW